MPATIAKYTPYDKALLDLAQKERRARAEVIKRNRDYYNGLHQKQLKGQDDNNVIKNLVGQSVDMLVEFCGVPRIDTQSGEDTIITVSGAELEKTEGELALERILETLGLDELVPDSFQEMPISGHIFYKLVLPQEGEVSIDNPPTLALIDSQYVNIYWDVMRPSSVLWYSLTYKVAETEYRQDIVSAKLVSDSGVAIPVTPLITDYVLIDYQKEKQSGNWFIYNAEVFPYDFCPIFETKANRAPFDKYGKPDLTRDKLSLQDACNFVSSNLLKIIKYHAHPRSVGIGITSTNSVINTGVDGFYAIPNKDAKVLNLEMQSDLGSSMKYLQDLERAFYTQMRVVSPETVKDKAGQLTNYVSRLMFLNMISHSEDKRARLQSILEPAIMRILEICNIEVPGIDITWPEALPIDHKEKVETASLEQQLGFTSDQTLASYLGRDFVSETNKRLEEQQLQIDSTVNRLAALAQQGAF